MCYVRANVGSTFMYVLLSTRDVEITPHVANPYSSASKTSVGNLEKVEA